MTLFHFAALSKDGKKISSTVDVESEEALMRYVQRRGMLLVHYRKGRRKRRVALYPFLQALAPLVKAGLPLMDALAVMHHSQADELLRRLQQGQGLAAAAAAMPELFDRRSQTLLAAAQASGNLSAALQTLENLLGKEQQMRKKLISLLLYPAMIFAVCCAVVLALLFVAIPALRELFPRPPTEGLTGVIFATSAAAVRHQNILLMGLAGIVAAGVWMRQMIKAAVVRLMPIARFRVVVAMGPIFATLGALVSCGVPLTESLAQAEELAKTSWSAEWLKGQKRFIEQGGHMSGRLPSWMPPVAVRLIAIGEQTGGLGQALSQLGQLFEEEADRSMQTFLQLLLPLLLVVMGLIVAGLMAAVLVPLTDASLLVGEI